MTRTEVLISPLSRQCFLPLGETQMKAADEGSRVVQYTDFTSQSRKGKGGKGAAEANRVCPLHEAKSLSPLYSMQSLIYILKCLLSLQPQPYFPVSPSTQPVFLQFLQHIPGIPFLMALTWAFLCIQCFASSMALRLTHSPTLRLYFNVTFLSLTTFFKIESHLFQHSLPPLPT